MPRHDFVHFEIAARDLEESRRFYEGLFDWRFSKWGGGEEYVVFRTPGCDDSLPQGCTGGALFKSSDIRPGNNTLMYIAVTEIEPYLAKVKLLGGTVASGKQEIPGVGWMAVLHDPSGNAIGIFQEQPAEPDRRGKF